MKRSSLMKKVAATGLAAAMTLCMSVPAFAADTTEVVSKSGSSYVISKTLKTPSHGVTKPSENYTFTIEAGTADTTDGSKAGVLPGSATNGSYTKTVNATDLTGSDGTYTGVTTSDIFSDIEYTAEGIYNYTVTETAGSQTNMTYSENSYAVKVKVVEDASENFNISGVTASLNGTKTDSIAFTNTYTPWGNDPSDPGNPGSETSGGTDSGLVISKATDGTEASDDDEFEFSITFTADANTNSNGAIETTMTSSTDSSNTATAVTYDSAYTFKLHNGEKINFKVPAGTKYVVTETNTKGYTSTSVKVNGSDVSSASQANSYSTGEQYVSTSANTVAYTNSHDVGTLTGVINQYGSLLAVIAIAAVGAVLVIMRRRRENA